ncbi:hypothetical protein P4H32_29315 [Bacillus cereus]|nr:hypothetical protein [Bacillus cereus]
MKKAIFPETITKAQAAALEAVKALPEFANVANILDAHSTDPKGWGADYAALNDMDYRQLYRALKYGYTTNVKVKRIIITRGEGPGARNHYLAKSWEEADKILKRLALTAPRESCDKTDFEILFTNGDQYRGTYELKAEDRFCASLYEHVKGHCEFYGGICKRLPNHIKSREQYLQIIGDDAAVYLQFLDNVLYPSANEKGLDPELLRSIPVKASATTPKRNFGMLYKNLTIVISDRGDQTNDYKYYVYANSSNHTAFRSKERLERWMNKFSLTLGDMIQENTYRINGAYRVTMIDNREDYLHLPQIAILMNGGMVRAYKEDTPEATNIYVVANYPERFKFDYDKPSGKWYLQKFFWS